MTEAPAHSTLAYANQHRPWQVFEELYLLLSAMLAAQLSPAERAPRLRLPERLLSLDSTVVDLCAKQDQRRREAASAARSRGLAAAFRGRHRGQSL